MVLFLVWGPQSISAHRKRKRTVDFFGRFEKKKWKTKEMKNEKLIFFLNVHCRELQIKWKFDSPIVPVFMPSLLCATSSSLRSLTSNYFHSVIFLFTHNLPSHFTSLQHGLSLFHSCIHLFVNIFIGCCIYFDWMLVFRLISMKRKKNSNSEKNRIQIAQTRRLSVARHFYLF